MQYLIRSLKTIVLSFQVQVLLVLIEISTTTQLRLNTHQRYVTAVYSSLFKVNIRILILMKYLIRVFPSWSFVNNLNKLFLFFLLPLLLNYYWDNIKCNKSHFKKPRDIAFFPISALPRAKMAGIVRVYSLHLFISPSTFFAFFFLLQYILQN